MNPLSIKEGYTPQMGYLRMIAVSWSGHSIDFVQTRQVRFPGWFYFWSGAKMAECKIYILWLETEHHIPNSEAENTGTEPLQWGTILASRFCGTNIGQCYSWSTASAATLTCSPIQQQTINKSPKHLQSESAPVETNEVYTTYQPRNQTFWEKCLSPEIYEGEFLKRMVPAVEGCRQCPAWEETVKNNESTNQP